MTTTTIDGVTHVVLTQHEAAELQHALCAARPRGTCATRDGRVVVHVSSDAAPAGETHVPVDADPEPDAEHA